MAAAEGEYTNDTNEVGIGAARKPQGNDFDDSLGDNDANNNDNLSEDGSDERTTSDTATLPSDAPSEESMNIERQQKQLSSIVTADDASDVASEASMKVLLRYMGCSATPYMSGPKRKKSMEKDKTEEDHSEQYKHDLREGDHVIRWKMLGYCYPIQVHGIVFSAGPDFVTIVDCGLADTNVDRVGNFDDDEKNSAKKTRRRRMNILTLVDEKEIKKWTKIRYGEEVQLRVHSSNKKMEQHVKERKEQLNDPSKQASNNDDNSLEDESSSAGLELEEVEQCVNAKIKTSPEWPKKAKGKKSPPKRSPSSWFSWSSCDKSANSDKEEADDTGETTKQQTVEQQRKEKKESTKGNKSQMLRLPKTDPPILVLARLRFLLEYGEEPFPSPGSSSCDNDDGGGGTKDNSKSNKDAKSQKQQPRRHEPNLLPPHHLLYANSECIAVYCKTGNWSTLQASIFLHSSTVGNAKQTATVAMFLSAQTVTVPASGFWGFFGGTTTVSLFTAQPWLVPALVGGGMVYIGLPMLMLVKAKGRWADTEKRLNDAFWSMYDTDVIVELIRCWSGLVNGREDEELDQNML